jgi:hypothetical protein
VWHRKCEGRYQVRLAQLTLVQSNNTVRFGVLTIRYRLSAIGYRLSAIGYRLSAIGYRLSAIGYRLASTESLKFVYDRVWPSLCKNAKSKPDAWMHELS